MVAGPPSRAKTLTRSNGSRISTVHVISSDVVHANRPQPRARTRVVAHADLGAEHILALDGRLTGIIDWSDAAITDPAVDFARVYRDFGPGVLEDAIGGLRRARGRDGAHRVLRTLRRVGGSRLRHADGASPNTRANAERSFGWLFPQRA